jgi:hypothetical protein
MSTLKRRAVSIAIALLAAVIGISGSVSPAKGLINGTRTDLNEYPFAVRLKNNAPGSDPFFCAATLVDPFYVMTAAHCVTDSTGRQNVSDISALIGATDTSPSAAQGEWRRVTEFNIHPRYLKDQGSTTNDLAVLKLDQASTKPVVQLAQSESPSDFGSWKPGTQATAIGWGRTSPTVPGGSWWLLEATMPILSDPDTASRLPGVGINNNLHIGAGANGKASCIGDSGGALLIDTPQGKKQIGVSSFVGSGCATDRPSVFAESAGSLLSRWVRTIIDPTPSIADVDGDGDGDLVIAKHQPEKLVHVSRSLYKQTGQVRQDRLELWHDNFFNDGDQVLLADYNGDRKADIWSITNTDIWVATSTGSNFYGSDGTSAANIVTRGETVKAGDVNGDGRADLVIFQTLGGYRRIDWARSTPTGFAQRVSLTTYYAYEGTTNELIDLNGDRKVDAVTFSQNNVQGPPYVYTATSTGTAMIKRGVANSDFGWAGQQVTVGFFNNDRNGDIVAFSRDNTYYDVWVGLRGSDEKFGSPGLWHDWFGSTLHTLDAADVNGDGLDDIVAFTNGAPFGEYWVALNEAGGRFGAGQLIAYYNA